MQRKHAVAKILGPLIYGRTWCGYVCWKAMVLDFLPFKVPKRKIVWIRYITFILSLFLFRACLFIDMKSRKNNVLGFFRR